jgi:hypothetical protein
MHMPADTVMGEAAGPEVQQAAMEVGEEEGASEGQQQQQRGGGAKGGVKIQVVPSALLMRKNKLHLAVCFQHREMRAHINMLVFSEGLQVVPSALLMRNYMAALLHLAEREVGIWACVGMYG